jgi:hypothetical protein
VSCHATVAWRKRNVLRSIAIQRSHELWNKLAADGIRMTHRAKVARRRGHDRKLYDQDNVIQRTQKVWTSRMRLCKKQECKIDIRGRRLSQQLRGSKRIIDLGVRLPLCLRKKRTTNVIRGWSAGQ